VKTAVINPDVKSKVMAELHSGEELLWADKSRKLILSFMEKFMVAFLIFWLAVTTLMIMPSLFTSQETYKITYNGVPTEVSFLHFLLFASLFPAIGLFMLACLIGGAKIRTGQIYAVTNSRSILISTFLVRRVTSFPHGKLIKISRHGKDDFGSIEFQRQENSKWFSFDPGWFFEMQLFSGIKNPKRVEALILSLQSGEKKA